MKKLNIIPVFLILIAGFFLAGCEEVIHLELKNSKPRMVIDATLNATSGECKVLMTKTLDFYQTDSFVKVEGAKVELVNSDGSALELSEVAPGAYRADNLAVMAGEVYKLNIVVSPDETYSAEAKVPAQIFLDSLKVVRGFGDPRPTAPPIYLLNPKWKDPYGMPNFYRFKVTKNGKEGSGSFAITNDEPFDGTEVDMPLYRFSFELGDTVRLEFQSIDSISYSYFNQINDMARPSFVSATPYNPIGNFDNSALGYFGIFYTEVRDLIIVPRK
jgi:hypothetical protein